MTEAKQIEDRMSEYKMFYFEVRYPFYAQGGMVFFGRERSKLMQVEAASRTDAVISALKQVGFVVTDENIDRVTEITKEQYDLRMLERSVGELRVNAHDMFYRTSRLFHLSAAAFSISIASLVLSLVMLWHLLASNGVL